MLGGGSSSTNRPSNRQMTCIFAIATLSINNDQPKNRQTGNMLSALALVLATAAYGVYLRRCS